MRYQSVVSKPSQFSNYIFVSLLQSIGAGNGLDLDEYVRKAYKFAYPDGIELGPLACLPEPPDPNELYPRQSSR